tara:strand:- start:82 stop:411 length:330 start_codon:yes stop_codon:yes gene_type:complete
MECPECGGIMSLSEGGNLSSKSCPFCDINETSNSGPSIKLNAHFSNALDYKPSVSVSHKWHSSHLRDKRSWMRRRKIIETLLVIANKAKSMVGISMVVLGAVSLFFLLR